MSEPLFYLLIFAGIANVVAGLSGLWVGRPDMHDPWGTLVPWVLFCLGLICWGVACVLP